MRTGRGGPAHRIIGFLEGLTQLGEQLLDPSDCTLVPLYLAFPAPRACLFLVQHNLGYAKFPITLVASLIWRQGLIRYQGTGH